MDYEILQIAEFLENRINKQCKIIFVKTKGNLHEIQATSASGRVITLETEALALYTNLFIKKETIENEIPTNADASYINPAHVYNFYNSLVRKTIIDKFLLDNNKKGSHD